MPLTEDFTYMLNDNGVVLNASANLPPFVDIQKVSGFDSAEVRLTERQHEGTDGGFVDAEFEQSRTLVLEGVAYGGVGAPLEPYLDSLKANWAPSSTSIPLYFKHPDVAERVFFVKPLGCRYDLAELRRLGQTEIQFTAIAEDPRAYDSQLQTVNIAQGDVIVTGRGYPKGYPRGYGTPVVPNGSSLFVSGNRPTPPTITIPGPCTNIQIINDTTGDIMVFDIVLLSGQTMIVDMNYRSITVNGQNRRTTLRNPNWFLLSPGNNYLRFRAESNNKTIGPPINANPFFETDASNWTWAGGTLVQSTLQAHEGSGSGLLTPDGVTATTEARTNLVAVNKTTTYQGSAWVRCAVSRNVGIGINWHDSADVYLSTSPITSVSVASATWTQLTSASVTPPAGAAKATLWINMTGTPPSSNTLHIDEGKLYQLVPSSMTVNYRSAWR